MGRLAALALVLGGIALACLLVGMGAGSDCSASMGSAACLGGSLGGARSWFGFASAAVAIAAGVMGVSLIIQARRHGRFASVLQGMAHPHTLADHPVGVVSGLSAPVVAGLRRPRIYCPEDLEERLSQPELRAVLLHERHHQVSHAPARLIVLAAVSPVARWIPAGPRWLEARRAEIEIDADEHALAAGARRSDLAQALLKFEPAGVAGELASYASASELRLRHLIGDGTEDRRRSRAIAPLLVPIAAFAMCLLMGLAS